MNKNLPFFCLLPEAEQTIRFERIHTTAGRVSSCTSSGQYPETRHSFSVQESYPPKAMNSDPSRVCYSQPIQVHVLQGPKMPPRSVFIFDSSFQCADIALPIDDTVLNVVVSDRDIEAPPGHKSLKLEEFTCFAAFRRNLQRLRSDWSQTDGERCIVIASSGVRKEQILINSLCALSLCRNVFLFDGLSSRALVRSWRLILGSAARVLGRCVLGGLKARIEKERFDRNVRFRPDTETPEGRLFGIYTRDSSFSLPLDRVNREPDACSIYGDSVRGWYLPSLSNRLQRYTVHTTRHYLSDIFLHVENVGGASERFLFKDGRILDYPYLLLTRARHSANLSVSTRAETKSIERGIDMLHFTTGYYHWLVDGVPRLLDLIDDGIDFEKYPLIMPPLEHFHRQLLDTLGISSESQVVIVGKDDWCHVGDCVFPTLDFPFAARGLDDYSTHPNGSMLRRIRERILARLPRTAAASTNASKRIYISRAKATKRKLTPESEAAVRTILESRGFQTICLEELPWPEQVRLLENADFVVGVHGAGLTNILFAKSLTLLELQNPLEARAYFAVIARELNMRYTYSIGKLHGHSNNFDNITIDPKSLSDLLDRLRVDS